MAGGGSIITSSALSAGLLIFSFIGLTGDTNENYDSFSKGSTKNERKINPKSKQSAESKVEDLEQQLSNAKTKKEKEDIKRQLRHWREKANQKSEPHGRSSVRR